MTNLTFSSVSSVIFTVGWLAYGITEAKLDVSLSTHFTLPLLLLEDLHGNIYEALIGLEM